MLTTSLTLHLPYQSPAPYSLLPCPSMAAATSSSAVACAAAAKDYVDLDLTGSIEVSVTSNGILCSLTQMTTGFCPPGSYSVVYSVTDSQGLTSQATINILVEQRTRVILNYTFVASSAQATAALALPSNAAEAMAQISEDLPWLGYDKSLLRSAALLNVSVATRKTGLSSLAFTYVTLIWDTSFGTIPSGTWSISSFSPRRSLRALLQQTRSLLHDDSGDTGSACSSLSPQALPPLLPGSFNPITSSRPPVVSCTTPLVNQDSILSALIYTAVVNVSRNFNALSSSEVVTLTETGLTNQLMDYIEANYSSIFQTFYSNETSASILLSSRVESVSSAANSTMQAFNLLLSTLTDSIIGDASLSLTADSVLQG